MKVSNYIPVTTWLEYKYPPRKFTAVTRNAIIQTLYSLHWSPQMLPSQLRVCTDNIKASPASETRDYSTTYFIALTWRFTYITPIFIFKIFLVVYE
jgi:hypothetical protein